MAYEVVWRWKLTNNCILLLVVLLLQIFWKLWAVECSNFMQIGGGSQWFTECEHARTNVWFKLLDPGKTQVAREVDYVTLLKNAKHLFFHRDFLSALLGNRKLSWGKNIFIWYSNHFRLFIKNSEAFIDIYCLFQWIIALSDRFDLSKLTEKTSNLDGFIQYWKYWNYNCMMALVYFVVRFLSCLPCLQHFSADEWRSWFWLLSNLFFKTFCSTLFSLSKL